MSSLPTVIALVAGLVAGGIVVWLFLKSKISGAAAEARAQLEPQLATLTERVAAKERQVGEWQSLVSSETDEKTQLAVQLQQESNARAVVEERAKQLEEQLAVNAGKTAEGERLLEAKRQQLEEARADVVSARGQLEVERKTLGQVRQEHLEARKSLEQQQGELLVQRRQNGELTEKVRFLEERLGTQRQEIDVIQQKFQKEFEAVANRLLMESSRQFDQKSTESLDKLLGPFRENLKEFRTKLDSVQQSADTHSALLKDQIARIGTEAANLSKALKGDVKVLGNWGENMLDQILDRSGLQSGVHYRRQSAAKNDAGDQRFLDVVVELPEDRHLVIDSKVSLKAYEEYVNSTDEAGRERRLAAHIDSLRNHFRGLSAKRYHETHGINTPDFVLMYVPIEAAFFVAVGQEPGLFSEALEKNVVLITNSTLLATLRTVAHVWRLADQQKNALEIADRGGKLYDKFHGFISDLEEIGKALGSAQEVWAEANRKLHQGPGNLVGQVEKLRALGVKASKKLSTQLASSAEDEASPPLINGNPPPDSSDQTEGIPHPPNPA